MRPEASITQANQKTKMSIKTKLALSAVIVLSTAPTASAATKKQKIAVHRSRPHVQAIVPRTAPLAGDSASIIAVALLAWRASMQSLLARRLFAGQATHGPRT
jgi:hypothetical protein